MTASPRAKANPCEADGTVRLRIGTYNHQRGGVDERGDGSRLLAQLDQLAGQDLDVLVSTEARWHGRYSYWLGRATRRLRMKPLYAPAIRGDHHVVVWTRAERVHVVDHSFPADPPRWHAHVHAELKIAGLADTLWLAGLHLSPRSPDLRRIECDVLGSELAGRPVVLAGDFNDDGTGDTRPAWDSTPASSQGHRPDSNGLTADDHLARYGFTDAAVLALPNPADREPTAGFGHDAAQRRDRILLARLPQVQVTAYRIGPYLPELSDHRSVYAELLIVPP